MMIERQATKAAIRLAEQFPVIAITGPRQSGKTTLAKAAFPEKKYVTFDDRKMRNIAESAPEDFLKAFPNGAIIDEAQKVPDIFDAIKLVVDKEKYTPGKFILTGSSQFRLKENITDSLAGRIGLINLLPFSIEELKNAGLLSDEPYDYAFGGFYPPLYDSERNYLGSDWFENYIDTYLDLDVKEWINPSNIRQFRKLLQLCAATSGQTVNYEWYSNRLDVSAVTVKSWLSILEASFIIHFLEPDYNNFTKSITKTPKLYFVDTGLMCHLLRLEAKEELLIDDHKGAVVETMAVAELMKSRLNNGRKANLTFFRNKNGLEVDVIADWKEALAIEIKSSSNADNRFSSGLKKYLALHETSPKGCIFYLGDLTCKISDINYISWKDWGTAEAFLK